ncbi:MAG: glutathione S-transferase domain-containing protein [Candidatus Thiodiazotropha endolucinida]|nr:glutathione S-transferase domain-containing protein [Candidatus Thiodiazotropha endolucinida]MCW4250140.1 glutathione S-transferase domain-containing protein [Candidatus Thiodiazotropha endolucinida]MCW4260597.1 glutathione S-transferase domain-containing protein [Candidatus Thiodiazotropha endolucinida]MCW4268491.1 glutathione S-transferase domain-containing protein [Candidatus Thiodiazotropha endolucinida]MCW4269828.1 glutathione S-transferase domain-containing protein [Candidatus Thiodiaz
MLRIREATHGNPLKNPTNKPLKFYSAWYCPFAQRAWMTLLHKQLDFEYIEVDPYRKCQWWLEISRNSAKVPVIVQLNLNDAGESTIIDSTLPTTGSLWSRYSYWYESMLETSSFRATSTDHDNYRQRLIEFYLPYSLGQGQKDVTET